MPFRIITEDTTLSLSLSHPLPFIISIISIIYLLDKKDETLSPDMQSMVSQDVYICNRERKSRVVAFSDARAYSQFIIFQMQLRSN